MHAHRADLREIDLPARAGPDSAAASAPGILSIDLAALGRNYLALGRRLSPSLAGAVVKADAYGLGAERVSQALYAKGCRTFFTAHFGEAMRLRPALAGDARIVVLNGLLPGNEIACAEAGIIPVINGLEQWHTWLRTALALGRRLQAVVQFDTGMSRLGVAAEDRAALAAAIRDTDAVEILFIMSHLACADESDSGQNEDQLAEMRAIADEFPGMPVSFANSGGVFLAERYHGALARPGIALYGGAATAGGANRLEPVVGIEAAVIQTRRVTAGTRIGYAAAHVAAQDMHLATLAIGYADGLPRSLSDRGAFYHCGIRLPIVGRVSMDSTIVDISALPEGSLSLGSMVELIGPHQTLDDLAAAAGTISYEILTGLGDRFDRQYRQSL